MAFAFAEHARRSANGSASEAVAASAYMAAYHAEALVACTEVRTYSQRSSAGDPALSFPRSHSRQFSNESCSCSSD